MIVVVVQVSACAMTVAVDEREWKAAKPSGTGGRHVTGTTKLQIKLKNT